MTYDFDEEWCEHICDIYLHVHGHEDNPSWECVMCGDYFTEADVLNPYFGIKKCYERRYVCACIDMNRDCRRSHREDLSRATIPRAPEDPSAPRGMIQWL